MEKKEVSHFLKVLVELELYPNIRILTEGNLSKSEIEKEQLKSIINFINKLPEDYKNIADRDKIIAQTLIKLGTQINWAKSEIQEETFENEKITNKTDKKQISNKEDVER